MTDDGDTQLYRRLLDGVSDAVWAVDARWRVLYLNRAGERLMGVTAGEIVGVDARDAVPDVRGSEREAAVARVLAGGPAESLRVQHPRAGAWVQMTIEPDPVGARITVSNIDRVVELEHRLQLEAAILASVNDGIYGVDVNDRITFVNPAAERLLGYAPGALLGAKSHEALHHTRGDGTRYPEERCPLGRTLRDGQPRTSDEDTLWRADGSPIPVEYRAAAIVDGGQITGAVVTFRDLTPRLAAAQAELAAATALGTLTELQQSLQPPPPSTDDPRLGVYYLPADAAGAGGDLYDWQSLSDGMHLAVVDVVGKGLAAARDALAVTHALRLLVLAHVPLDKVVRQAAWLLADAHPDLAATVALAHYAAGTGRLRFVSAGHPPPLLIEPDGATRYLESSGRPIGWPDGGTDDVVEIVVPPGGRVLFYTDGLIEAGRDIVTGMATLAELAADLSASPAETARRLVTAVLSTAARRDDCLALIVERPRPGADGGGPSPERRR